MLCYAMLCYAGGAGSDGGAAAEGADARRRAEEGGCAPRGLTLSARANRGCEGGSKERALLQSTAGREVGFGQAWGRRRHHSGGRHPPGDRKTMRCRREPATNSEVVFREWTGARRPACAPSSGERPRGSFMSTRKMWKTPPVRCLASRAVSRCIVRHDRVGGPCAARGFRISLCAPLELGMHPVRVSASTRESCASAGKNSAPPK